LDIDQFTLNTSGTRIAGWSEMGIYDTETRNGVGTDRYRRL
jgi:hypothetical protein